MNPRIKPIAMLTTISLALILTSCSSSSKDKVAETKSTIQQVEMTSLEFDQGETQLSQMDQQHLTELAQKISSTGKVVDDIKIVTWSDRQVSNDEDATNTEIILARQRAESIKNYLEINLPAEEDIDFYNMADKPQAYSSFLKRKGVSIEKATGPDDRALVIIEYQNRQTPTSL